MLRLNYQMTNEPSDREAVSSKIKILGKQLEELYPLKLKFSENNWKMRFAPMYSKTLG